MFSYVAWRLIRSQSFKGFISLTVILSLAGTSLGVAVLITISSIMNGFETDVKERIYSLTDHVRIYPDSEHSQMDWAPVVRKIEANDSVESAVPYSGVLAVAMKDDVTVPLEVIGYPSTLISSFSEPLRDWLKSSPAGDFKAVNTSAMQDSFDINQGDKLVVMMPSSKNSLLGVNVRTKRIPIVKTIESTMAAFDRRVLYMHMEDVQQLQGSKSIQGYKVHLKDPLTAEAVTEQLKTSLGDTYRFETWVDNFQYLFDTMKIQKLALLFVFSLVIIIASFSLICGLVMMVNEKRTNIAVLLTLGMTPREIRLTFIVLGMFIAITGIFIGTGLGVLLSYHATSLCQLLESMLDVNLFNLKSFLLDYLPSELRWVDVLKIDIFCFFISFLAVIYPASKASNIYPAKVLRYE
ncbi:MAG TPA: FtsX-like permease family protein [Gammaproteobacteria bacterium]|nr:FtsX-like permease family protein [Gammaproteobacteria bacterium]